MRRYQQISPDSFERDTVAFLAALNESTHGVVVIVKVKSIKYVLSFPHTSCSFYFYRDKSLLLRFALFSSSVQVCLMSNITCCF